MNEIWLIPMAAVFSCASTYAIWRIAERRMLHDIPNERSMHAGRIAVGAGWAIVTTVIVFWPWVDGVATTPVAMICLAMLVLAAVSWLDDLRSLPPLWRLILQGATVALCLAQLPSDALALAGVVPRWLDRLLTGFCWLWFINLYNFMDGIDGLTGVETIGIASGYAVLAYISRPSGALGGLSLILIGAAAGFLVWNWHPARIILGDVGSIPLGFLLGWLMLDLAVRGHPAAAVLLPLHHIADATVTLVKRIVTVPRPWRPHRQHMYQRAVLGGLRPAQVVSGVAVLNLVLIALAVLSLSRPWLALGAGCIATASFHGCIGRFRTRATKP